MVMNAVAEFDDLYSRQIGAPDKYKQFIDEEDEDFVRKLFIIKKTTSKIAKNQIEQHNNNPVGIYIRGGEL